MRVTENGHRLSVEFLVSKGLTSSPLLSAQFTSLSPVVFVFASAIVLRPKMQKHSAADTDN